MKSAILLTIGVQLALTIGAAAACQGQTGAVIFEDTFADDSGGWDLTPGAADIKPPHLLITMGKQTTLVQGQNLTFNAVDADYCTEFTLPEQPAPDNAVAAAIEFWATDINNYYNLQVYTNKTIAFYKKTAGVWGSVFIIHDSPAVKLGPTDVNALRVIAKAGRLTMSLNGTPIKEIRAQTPPGALRFGFYAQMDKPTPNDINVTFDSFKVTTPP